MARLKSNNGSEGPTGKGGAVAPAKSGKVKICGIPLRKVMSLYDHRLGDGGDILLIKRCDNKPVRIGAARACDGL